MAEHSSAPGPVEQTPRPKKPNYALIHSLPIPVSIYPLPAFNPASPLSVLQLVYTFVQHWLSPPSSHQAVLHGLFSPETRSVHITDPATIRLLWERGFYGKGSLSRSEPTWLEREKKRRGMIALDTSEESTLRRREERRQMKLERARKEKELKEQRLKQEGKLSSSETVLASNDGASHAANGNVDGVPNDSAYGTVNGTVNGNVNGNFNANANTSANGSARSPKRVQFSETVFEVEAQPEQEIDQEIKDEEHLQLTLEEAFFLVYGLGVLAINMRNTESLSATELLPLFRSYSYFPHKNPVDQRADDPFLLNYVVYHHFRSLGWVVRPGVKFGVDYLLYNRGPVFSHAEFAVVIIPSYSHPSYRDDPSAERKERRDWWWFHSVSRVQTQVKKSVLLVYVEVPSNNETSTATSNEIDIGRILGRYKIREVNSKRWIPNRSRD